MRRENRAKRTATEPRELLTLLLFFAGLIALVVFVSTATSDAREQARAERLTERLPPDLNGSVVRHFSRACRGCALPSGSSFSFAVWVLPPVQAQRALEHGIGHLAVEPAGSDQLDFRGLAPIADPTGCALFDGRIFERVFDETVPAGVLEDANAAACAQGAFIGEDEFETIVLAPQEGMLIYQYLDPT